MGTLVFQATLGGAVNIIGPNIANTINFTLPSADGTSGQTWTTNGSGLLTFGTLGVAGGGTGLTTLATGSLSYGAGTSAFSTLAIGTAGQILTVNSGATAPQWSTLTGVAVTTFSAGTTGLTPSSATAGAVTLAGTLVAANGGTGQSSYAVGDLLYASTTTALSKLADVATGNALISGGVGVAPSWGKIGLTTHVSGTLPTANGGTNLTSFTSGGVVYASSTSALATGSALTFDGAGVLTVGSDAVATVFNAPGDVLQFKVDSNGNSGGSPNIQWLQASSELMRLTSTGLGIGTSSPVYKLDVRGQGYFATASGTIQLTLGDTSNGTTAGVATSNNNLIFYPDGSTERVRITSAGNLGIGTGSPAYKLQVAGTTPTIAINASNASASSTSTLLYRNADGNGNTYDVASIAGQTAGNGGYGTLIFSTAFNTSNTERARIDTNGNFGLGVTPSAWGSIFKPIQIGNAYSYVAGRTDGFRQVWLGTNGYYNGTNWIYGASQPSSQYYQNDGAHVWNTAASGTAGNTISFTQAMTLDASGNLALGTTSAGSYRQAVFAGNNANVVQFDSTAGNGGYLALSTSGTVRGVIGCGANVITGAALSDVGIKSDTNLLFSAGGATERARIDSSGNLLVGTSTSGNSRLYVVGASTTSSDIAIRVRDSSAVDMFYVRNDGLICTGARTSSPYNFTTASAANMFVDSSGFLYRSTSSLKYKTDVQDTTHGLEKVMALRPVTYKGKNDGDTVFGGLIAEEVHAAGLTEFVQYANDGTPDALAYGNMVSLAFKAIQELKAEFDAYKASHP